MAEVDKLHPGQFGYILNKDAGVTGNLECTIYSTKNAGNRQAVHAKKASNQGYPHQDWNAFNTRLTAALNTVRA